MGDPFMPAMKVLMDSFVSSQGLSWTTVIQSSPRRTEWLTMPMVIICPAPTPRGVEWMAFGDRNITSTYQVFLVQNNEAKDVADSQEDTFQRGCISIYEPLNNTLFLTGAWKSTAEPSYDFDRRAFPSGYSISCVEVVLDWIF